MRDSVSDSVSDPVRLLGMLAAEERLRAFAAVVLGARTSAEVGDRAELPAKATLQALTQMEREGVVERSVAGWEPRADTLRKAVVAAAPEPGADDHGAADASEAAVFRAFLRDGRLTAIPAQRRKRLVILEHLARMFEPGVYYTEREVNAILRAFHADCAALRRYLVDEEYLTRESGKYWRTGGVIDV